MIRKLSLLIALSSLIGVAKAQSDTALINDVYDAFESTVKNKEGAAHLELYTSKYAPVYIVRKNPSGPSTLGLLSAQGFVNIFTSGQQSYELKISDIHHYTEEHFAVTDARFDEYVSGNRSGFGRDLFGYIKTNEGWKLLFLHNTVVFESDTNDYSTPHPLSNTIADVLEDFNSNFNDHSENWTQQFMKLDNQIIHIKEGFPEDYLYFDYEVKDYLTYFLDSIENPSLSISATDTIICDDYLASVFADYTLKDGDSTLEEGRCYFNFFANNEHGWRLSSWIRDDRYDQTTGLNELENNRFNLYPNPSSDAVFIETNFEEPIGWTIYQSGSGNSVLKGSLLSAKQEILVAHLERGSYFIEFTSSAGKVISVKKLVLT